MLQIAMPPLRNNRVRSSFHITICDYANHSPSQLTTPHGCWFHASSTSNLGNHNHNLRFFQFCRSRPEHPQPDRVACAASRRQRQPSGSQIGIVLSRHRALDQHGQEALLLSRVGLPEDSTLLRAAACEQDLWHTYTWYVATEYIIVLHTECPLAPSPRVTEPSINTGKRRTKRLRRGHRRAPIFCFLTN